MGNGFLATVSIAVGTALLLPVQANGQPAVANANTVSESRTLWGDPDLQGTWSHGTATPLERPDEQSGREFLTEEEIAEVNLNATTFASSERRGDLSKDRDVGLAYNQFWWDRGLSDGRTALIVDPPNGKIPYTSTTQPTSGFRRTRSSDGPEDRNLWERCITRGVPRLGGAYNNNFRLIQAPGYVVILHEMVHESRIVPMDGRPHVNADIRQWNGDSRGRWDGDTLVVETTNFTDKTKFRGSSSGLKVVERFRRADVNTLQYQVTLEDSTTWTQPWTAALALPKTEGEMFEYACHEGNYGMTNLLAGARVQELEVDAIGSR
jgi:hypothetical protein